MNKKVMPRLSSTVLSHFPLWSSDFRKTRTSCFFEVATRAELHQPTLPAAFRSLQLSCEGQGRTRYRKVIVEFLL